MQPTTQSPPEITHLVFHAGHETLIFVLLIAVVIGLLYVALTEYVQYVEREVKAGRRKPPNSPYNDKDDDGPPPPISPGM